MFSDVENDFEKEDPKEKQTKKKKKNRDVLRDHAASGITVHVTGGPGPTAPGIPPPMEETGTANPTEKGGYQPSGNGAREVGVPKAAKPPPLWLYSYYAKGQWCRELHDSLQVPVRALAHEQADLWSMSVVCVGS